MFLNQLGNATSDPTAFKIPQVPSSVNAEQLCQWLSFYVTETRSCKCEPYPPKSLYQLLSGLLRHCRSLNPSIHNF